jgi:DNA polymerase I-like protein with 3'-5' exonuclease and polymerase domains
MKKALVIMDKELQQRGYMPGKDYEYVAQVHDEMQTECKPELAEEVGEVARKSIVKAGEYFNFRCLLDGEYEIGDSWAQTH